MRWFPFKCAVVLTVALFCLNSPAASLHDIRTGKIQSATVSGQVLDIIVSDPVSSIILFDDTDGISLSVAIKSLDDIHVGDMIQAYVRRISQFDYQANFGVRRIGQAPLPKAKSLTLSELSSYQCRPASIRGILHSAQRDSTNSAWNWMILKTPSGILTVAAREAEFPLTRLKSLIDAEMILSGYATPMVMWRAGLGIFFRLLKNFPMEVISPPARFEDIPAFSNLQNPHRQRISGKVLAATQNQIFISGANGVCCEVHASCGHPPVAAEDQVTVAGFFESGLQGYLITEAIVRIDSRSHMTGEKPAKITTGDLFKSFQGTESIGMLYYHRLVSIPGTVKGVFQSSESQKTILLGDDAHTVQVDVSLFKDILPRDIRPDCKLEATGFCHADFDRSPLNPADVQFRSFTILPRSVQDLRVLSSPPWWTPRLLLSIIGVLLATVVGVTFWNRSLSRLSERRGQMLFKEHLSLTEAQLKIAERTRLAVELHDALSQNLTGVSLQLDAVHRFADDKEKQSRHLDIARLTLKSCRNELRNCLWDLRNHALEEPDMNTAIRRTISPFIGDAKLIIRFNVPRERLSDDTAHALMRILRELATNAVKHGHAATIRIAGALENGQLLFSVKDDGDGFDPQSRPGVNDGHFGLEGIRERISRLHGHMELKSSLRQGTTVTISLMA